MIYQNQIYQNQKGSAFFLCILMGVIASICTLLLASQRPLLIKNTQIIRERLVEEETERLQSYYEIPSNAWAIDASSGPFTWTPSDSRIQFLSSNRIDCGNGVYAHVFVIYYPISGGTTIDPTTGQVTFGKDDIVKVINGCTIEHNLYHQTLERIYSLVERLESYFRAKVWRSGGAVLNYFVAPSCSGAGDFSCVTDADAFSVLSPVLRITEAEVSSAWNIHMRFDNNSAAVFTLFPPYKARVGFDTPWGTREWFYAVGG